MGKGCYRGLEVVRSIGAIKYRHMWSGYMYGPDICMVRIRVTMVDL
jgi:hypothetical protein